MNKQIKFNKTSGKNKTYNDIQTHKKSGLTDYSENLFQGECNPDVLQPLMLLEVSLFPQTFVDFNQVV